jgi:uncharacterized membrane protein
MEKLLSISSPMEQIELLSSYLWMQIKQNAARVNVPMNDRLAMLNPSSPEVAILWANYLTNWTAWNHVRTIVAIAATASMIMAFYYWTARS